MEVQTCFSSNSVLLVLPRWGSGLGGVYAMAHSIITKIRTADSHRPIACLVGVPLDELSEDILRELHSLNVTAVGPDIKTLAKTDSSPEDMFQNYSRWFPTVLRQINLQKVCCVLSFTSMTTPLTNYCVNHGLFSSECRVVMINIDTEEDLDDLACHMFQAFRRTSPTISKLCLGLSKLSNSFLERPYFVDQPTPLVPLYDGLFETSHSMSKISNNKNRIFVPLTSLSDKSYQIQFIDYCICSGKQINFNAEPDHGVEVVIQWDVNETRMPTEVCKLLNHDHTNYRLAMYTSRSEVTKEAVRAQCVIASGEFQESGFSGLEFLLNGIPTFVPEDSAVGQILKRASTTSAEILLLKSIRHRETDNYHYIISSDWCKKIMGSIKNKRFVFDVRNIAEEIRCFLSTDLQFSKGIAIINNALHVSAPQKTAPSSSRNVERDLMLEAGTWTWSEFCGFAVFMLDVRQEDLDSVHAVWYDVQCAVFRVLTDWERVHKPHDMLGLLKTMKQAWRYGNRKKVMLVQAATQTEDIHFTSCKPNERGKRPGFKQFLKKCGIKNKHTPRNNNLYPNMFTFM